MSTDKLNEIAERLWEHPTLNGIRAALDEARQEDRAEIERLQESWIAESKLRQAAEAKLAEAQSPGKLLYEGLCSAVLRRIFEGPDDWVDVSSDVLLRLESYIRRAELLGPTEDALAAERAKTAELTDAIGCGGRFDEPCLDAAEPCWEHELRAAEAKTAKLVEALERIAQIINQHKTSLCDPCTCDAAVRTALHAALAAAKASEPRCTRCAYPLFRRGDVLFCGTENCSAFDVAVAAAKARE